jgi:hypothetical protein
VEKKTNARTGIASGKCNASHGDFFINGNASINMDDGEYNA